MRAHWGTVREIEENESIEERFARAWAEGGARALAVRDVVRIGVEMLDSLAAVHDRGFALGFAPLPFVAPERLAGEPASVSADLYSVSALLYLAATGHPPCATLAHADLPARLVRVLVQALQRDPERRFSDAREMRDALASVGAGSRSGMFPCVGMEEEEEEALPPTRRLGRGLALAG